MVDGIHIEVILAGGYVVLLACAAAILEHLARRSHSRTERYRNSGFTYKKEHDAWECPTGEHLRREKAHPSRKVAIYRAPAHKCNVCHCKKHCTDSDTGRVLESRPNAWLESELSRFHRGISLLLLCLAGLILAVEMVRQQARGDWLLLIALLIPIVLAGASCGLSLSQRMNSNRAGNPGTPMGNGSSGRWNKLA